MKRQTQPHGLAERWPARPLDIDPFSLPTEYGLDVHSTTGRLLRARDHITIAGLRINVTREVFGRRTQREIFEAGDFLGVAVRIQQNSDAEDDFAVSVNLHHCDARLCIPLHMAFDMCDVGARWQSWAKALRLPLLLPALDGTWREPVERLGKLVVRMPMGRSSRKALAGRRSLISSLREVCRIDRIDRITGREMIARS